MSKQLALSIAVSFLSMLSFALLGQQAQRQLAAQAREMVELRANLPGMPLMGRLLPDRQ